MNNKQLCAEVVSQIYQHRGTVSLGREEERLGALEQMCGGDDLNNKCF